MITPTNPPNTIDEEACQLLYDEGMLRDFNPLHVEYTTDSEDEILVLGDNEDTGEREYRVYSVQKEMGFRDCWNPWTEQHYTEDTDWIVTIELLDTIPVKGGPE